MLYLSFDFDLLERLPEMSRAAGIPPGDLCYGCLLMWRYCWREKLEHVLPVHLDGFFGCRTKELVAALAAFGVVTADGDRLRVRGADRYKRIAEVRRRGADRTNAKRHGSDAQATHERRSSDAQATLASRSSDAPKSLGDPFPPPHPPSSPSEQRAASSEHTPLPPSLAEGGGVSPAPARERPPHRKVRVTECDGTLREIDPTAEPELDETQGRIHGRWQALLQSVRGIAQPQPSPAGAVSAAAALVGRPEAEQDALLERFVRDDEKKLVRAGWPLSWFPARMNGYLAVSTSPTTGTAGYSNDRWAGRKGGEVKL